MGRSSRRIRLDLHCVGQRRVPEYRRSAESSAFCEAVFCGWKNKFGGLGVSDLRRLRQRRYENRHLERLLADLSLNKETRQELLRKKLWRRPSGVRAPTA